MAGVEEVLEEGVVEDSVVEEAESFDQVADEVLSSDLLGSIDGGFLGGTMEPITILGGLHIKTE